MRRTPSGPLAPDVLFATSVAALSIALWWPTERWFLDVCASFRVHLGVLSVLLGFARLSIRRWLPAACWAVSAGFCLTGPLIDSGKIGLSPGTAHVRVLVQNVHTNNHAFNLVSKTIREAQPDLVALLETDDLWAGAVQEHLGELFPYSKVRPRSDNFGMGMFSRMPLDGTIFDTPPLEVPSIEAITVVEGKPLRVIATHTIPPLSAEHTRFRNQHIAYIVSRISESQIPTLLVGDFNLVPTSPAWRRLFATSPVKRLQAGLLPVGTWPSTLGILGASIDHVFISDGLVAVGVAVLPDVGSDHRGLVVDLSLAE